MDNNNKFTSEESLRGTLIAEEMHMEENMAGEETSLKEERPSETSEEVFFENQEQASQNIKSAEKEDNTGEETENDKETESVEENESEEKNDLSEGSSDKDIENVTLGELYTLCNEFPEEKVASDVISESFKIFASGRKGTANDIYKDYLRLKKCFENAEESSKVRLHSGFDSYGKAINQAHNLTKRQMQIARESGMSFSEYSELLSSIPQKGKRVLS